MADVKRLVFIALALCGVIVAARGAGARGFPGAQIGREVVDPVRKTKAFVVGVKALLPGPTAAGLTYVFGATSGRLIHINIDWQYPAATAADRAAILTAGANAAAGYIGYFWKFGSEAHGVVAAINSVVLFAAADARGNSVEVRVQGVPYDLKRAGAAPGTPAIHVDPPPGQALLHIGLSRSDVDAEVYMIKPGDF